MGESRQPHLNGAFYGPSIPPPSKRSYHRPGRGGGGSSCNPFSCCCGCLCSCLFNCIFQIILTIGITIGIVVLVLWLIFRPNNLKFYATDASLAQFELSDTNNTLYYNLALNFTVRNPNKRIGVYYDNIEAQAFYQGERFGLTPMSAFYQGHKNTSFLNAVFRGQNVVALQSDAVANYHSEKNSGSYSIDVKLYLRIRLKVGWAKTSKLKPKVKCELKIPMNSNGTSSGKFESTKCDLDW